MHKFTRSVLELEIYGQEYKLGKLTLDEAQEFGKETKDLDDQARGEKLLGLLEKKGLPKDLILSMEVDHITELVNLLMPAKKK